MGCGCNKIRTYSQTNPLLIGDDDGSGPVNVRTTVSLMGMRAGSEFWTYGSGVQPMVDSGWLVLI